MFIAIGCIEIAAKLAAAKASAKNSSGCQTAMLDQTLVDAANDSACYEIRFGGRRLHLSSGLPVSLLWRGRDSGGKQRDEKEFEEAFELEASKSHDMNGHAKGPNGIEDEESDSYENGDGDEEDTDLYQPGDGDGDVEME